MTAWGNLDSINDSWSRRDVTTHGDVTRQVTTSAEDDVTYDDCLTSTDAADDILLLASSANKASMEKGCVEITVDSGATEVVAPLGIRARLPHQGVGKLASRSEVSHRKRGRNRQPRRNTCDSPHRIRGSQGHTVQIANFTGRGHDIVLDEDDAYILHKATNRKVPLLHEGERVRDASQRDAAERSAETRHKLAQYDDVAKRDEYHLRPQGWKTQRALRPEIPPPEATERKVLELAAMAEDPWTSSPPAPPASSTARTTRQTMSPTQRHAHPDTTEKWCHATMRAPHRCAPGVRPSPGTAR